MQKMSTYGLCHLKRHFVVCTKLYLRRSEGRLWMIWAIDRHKNHLSGFVQAAFFDALYSEYESSLPFVNMKHPFIDITKVVLKRLENRLCVLRAIRLFKTSLNVSKSLFSMRRMRKICSHALPTPWNIALSTPSKSFYKTSRGKIVSSLGHSPT
jgi:hypothetical protein